ncbi:MAG: hypothetical protein KGI60_02170 [Patescibacteria group bacterium]|nr:hypothetical protein [Patescibacteria group bacterium]
MNYINLYSRFLDRNLKPKRKLIVVFDCSNGTTGIVLKELFRKSRVKSPKSKVKAILINDRPDGNFPAHGPNPLIDGAMDQLRRTVIRRKADLGVAFDADGDRVFFTDNRGRIVAAEEMGFLLEQNLRPPFVTSENASWRLKKFKAKNSKSKAVYMSRVGHYYFKQVMRAHKASLGCEPSGHFYHKDFFYCDSGIFTAMRAINAVSASPDGLAARIDELPVYYRSGEINYKVADKKKAIRQIEARYRKQATHVSKLDGVTMEFGNEWWFNVRASNTENLLRLNMEATRKETLKRRLTEIGKML